MNKIYDFKDKKLLWAALTHGSFANEHHLSYNYQRLEFLGDAVLELIVSEDLFTKFESAKEGELTKARAAAVREERLAEVAQNIGIDKVIRLGKGEQQSGGRSKPSILSDVLEALIGAIYLDGGLDACKQFYKQCFGSFEPVIDYKTTLQEILSCRGAELQYKVVSESGKDHDKMYEVELLFKDKRLATAAGHNKKAAEQQAAEIAIKKLKCK